MRVARPLFYIKQFVLPYNKTMKNSNKRNLNKISKRNTHKRRSKERARDELLRIVAETNVGIDSLRIRDSLDGGRRDRTSDKHRRDELEATGIFSSSKSGFGFVSCEDRESDVFIPAGNTQGALDGDTVEIIYHTYTDRMGEEKTEGRIKRIVSYSRRTVIGTLEPDRRYRHRGAMLYIVKPDDQRLPEFRVKERGAAAIGDKVEARIIRSQAGIVGCEVIASFGASYTKEANYAAILAEAGIPTEFSAEELAEAEFFASMPLSEEGRERRDEIIFTIDGAGAKDLDDAISLRKIRGGWQLGVHIADVSAYVPERTHLDRAAMARGTSVYFTDKVVPMLPPALSNGACSLGAGEDKYALSAIINLDEEGAIKSTRVVPTIIRSRVRGVYSEVNEIFAGTADSATRVKYKAVIPTLMRMHELYLVLLRRSRGRGAMELEGEEAEILLDERGEPVDIIKRERGDAERLIEQFMLTANEAVARLLSERGIPCVYRIHEAPPPDKLADFLAYAHGLGFDATVISERHSEAKDFARLLELAEERGMLAQVSYTMLRSMSKAKYSETRHSHFGLSLDYYCHFTSPIRRLSDLATHRIIHKVLIEGKRPELYEKYARRAATAATEAEIRAVGAERRIENLYKVIYMSDKIGQQFDAVINSITSFGFFAVLENTCEGLVPISELPGMFTFDEKHLLLRSRRTTYHIADRVRVRLEEADIISGKLRFSVV